jgi:hypothetical protein
VTRLLFLVLAVVACGRQERPVAAGEPEFRAVRVDRSRVLTLDLRGPDFEEARGKSCPLEALVETADGGDPVLRFRCATFGAP